MWLSRFFGVVLLCFAAYDTASYIWLMQSGGCVTTLLGCLTPFGFTVFLMPVIAFYVFFGLLFSSGRLTVRYKTQRERAFKKEFGFDAETIENQVKKELGY